jgi:release factor glutamine methyltransferase
VTIDETLAHGTGLLAASSASPRTDALLLLESVLRRPRAWIVAHGEERPTIEDAAEFLRLCERRASGMPLAYVLGSAGFYGRDFVVNETVLVPRPETEHLIDEAIAFIEVLPEEGTPAVLDLGTGSGAIACTIAAQTRARVDAIDISPAAIAVAMENARRLRVSDRCRFLVGDLTAPLDDERYDVVIANLPYMPTADIPSAPNPLSFEPRLAVDGGPDGLSAYRRLLPTLERRRKPHALVLMEAAPPTIVGLEQLAVKFLKEFVIDVRADYAGLRRYIKAESRLEPAGSAR